MNHSIGREEKRNARVLKLSAIALVLVSAVIASRMHAQTKATAAPAAITPPAGNSVFLIGRAVGTQGYNCLPTNDGFSWTANASRPEATLFDGELQVITHFLSPDTNPNEFAPSPLPVGSPTWQSSSDSSMVWAKALTPSVTAGSDASCPNAGGIACLLLRTIGSKPGPAGGKVMTQTTFIQRF